MSESISVNQPNYLVSATYQQDDRQLVRIEDASAVPFPTVGDSVELADERTGGATVWRVVGRTFSVSAAVTAVRIEVEPASVAGQSP